MAYTGGETGTESLLKLRHELHQHPCVSNDEEDTARRITTFLSGLSPSTIIQGIGGHGLAAIYDSKKEGPTLMFRCELDALPIQDAISAPYASVSEGKGHKCGHDGHMTIISGLAQHLATHPPAKGRVILLYQPAEETGEGARRILADEKFASLRPDYIFALHNIPGYPKGQILYKNEVLCAASRGMIIQLKGKPSHAGHPENGINPTLAASQIIGAFFSLPSMNTPLHQAALITPIHIRVGHRAFGTSAGDGELMFTLRTYSDNEMKGLTEKAEAIARGIASTHGLEIAIEWTDDFEAVKNNDACTNIIERAAHKAELTTTVLSHPFPWSEDFGLFTSAFKGAMFGLGSGENQPQLHNEDYDFPDDILGAGLAVLTNIIEEILNT